MKVFTGFYPTTTAATSFATGALALGDARNYAFGVNFSGSDVAGTLTLEWSTTPDFTRFWIVASSSTAVTLSAKQYYNVADANYPFVRLRWAYTSGTGNITVDGFVPEPYITRGG